MSPETPFDVVFRAERALIDGTITAAEIAVRHGIVLAITPLGSALPGQNVVTLAADELLLPGLVDTHVHVNEPGRTDWEGFATATRAAAAGGVTTLIDMPLNSIPATVTVDALDVKRRAADGQLAVDVGFWGGIVPGTLDQVEPLIAAGVFGFKCFLADSGVPEFPPLDADEMEAAMRVIAAHDSMLLVHAEDAGILDAAHYSGGTDYAGFLASRPRSAENTAIHEVIARARQSGARTHVLHLSSAGSLAQIARAKRDGIDLSVETCPHYLCLSAEEIPAGATAFKCCPPIRDASNRDQLWAGLVDGTIDYIASDHSPSTPELKYRGGGDFGQAWGGIASLQLGLPLVWTEARRRGIQISRVVDWMSAAPARRAGLNGPGRASKGRIVPGGAADFAVFAPEASFTVDAARLEHRHPISVYDGRTLFGVVRAAYLAGQLIERETPRGTMLRRPAPARRGAPTRGAPTRGAQR